MTVFCLLVCLFVFVLFSFFFVLFFVVVFFFSISGFDAWLFQSLLKKSPFQDVTTNFKIGHF